MFHIGKLSAPLLPPLPLAHFYPIAYAASCFSRSQRFTARQMKSFRKLLSKRDRMPSISDSAGAYLSRVPARLTLRESGKRKIVVAFAIEYDFRRI